MTPSALLTLCRPGTFRTASPSLFAAAKDAEDGREILQIDIRAAIIRVLRETEGDGTRARAANSRGRAIVGAIKNRPGCLIEQLREDSFDRGEVRVIIEMLFLDIQDDRVLRLEKAKRAVALVAFRHEIFAARIPMRVRAEERNFRANIVRRMQSALAQNMRRHGGSRRLAMHARDDDAALARHDRRQRFRAADKLFARLAARSPGSGFPS